MSAGREARPPAPAPAAPSSRRARPLCVCAGLLLGAACASSSARPAPAPVAASASVTPVVVVEAPPAVTMLAPVGAGAPVAASVVPSGNAAAGQLEVVPSHPVVAAALDPTLTSSQRRLFTGGRPVGDALGGVLREGQVIEQTMTVTAGCYAVVGLSPSLSLLGLELTGAASPLVARSSQGVASLGVPACVPLGAGEIRLRLIALGGAGPAVARLYSR